MGKVMKKQAMLNNFISLTPGTGYSQIEKIELFVKTISEERRCNFLFKQRISDILTGTYIVRMEVKNKV
jgi:hypothetical protein